MLTIGSLFSGVGGLELGLEWAGLGPTLWQVEKDPFCRAVLAKHWPDARRFDDVCGVGAADLAPVDLICGGFPCQDVSSAGRRAGLTGERSGLWREFARVVGERRPRWVVVENVTSGAARWVDAVVRELEQLGYACLPVPVAASDLGAPHQRARVFIVAACAADAPGIGRNPGLLGSGAVLADTEDAPANTDGVLVRLELGGGGRSLRQETSKPEEPPTYAPDDAGSILAPARSRVPAAPRHCGWAVEPSLARVVHGLPGRVDRERALGNSVVPQCAEVIGWVIRELAGLTEVA